MFSRRFRSNRKPTNVLKKYIYISKKFRSKFLKLYYAKLKNKYFDK